MGREEVIKDSRFLIIGYYEHMCTCNWKLVVGGKAGSPIEKYCRETGRNGITFEVVEDDKLEEWLTPPPEPKYVEFSF